MFFLQDSSIFSPGVGWSKEIEMSPEIMITFAKKNVPAHSSKELFLFQAYLSIFPWKQYLCDWGESATAQEKEIVPYIPNTGYLNV